MIIFLLLFLLFPFSVNANTVTHGSSRCSFYPDQIDITSTSDEVRVPSGTLPDYNAAVFYPDGTRAGLGEQGCASTASTTFSAWLTAKSMTDQEGDWKVVLGVSSDFNTNCYIGTSANYATCAAYSDTGEGVYFTRVVEDPPPDVPTDTSTSSDSYSQGQENLFNGILLFMIGFFGMIWLIRKH